VVPNPVSREKLKAKKHGAEKAEKGKHATPQKGHGAG
jgi:hypothetical protein